MSGFSTCVVQRDFSRAAQHYDEAAQLQHSVRAQCVERMRRLADAAAPLQVLDAGCGTGALAEQLAAVAPHWQVTGVDLAPEMCRVAAARLQGMVNADITALPFADNTFGMALSSLALQWVNEPQAALAEMLRVITPGGYAVVTSFGPHTLQELKEVFAEIDDTPRVSMFCTREQMVRQAQLAGWQVVDAQEEIRETLHASVAELMHSLKSIGAVNKNAQRRRGLTAPSLMRRAEEIYARRFGRGGVLLCNWETQLFLLRKA